MALDEILAAISGAASGGLKGYSWAKEFEQADRKIEQDGEIKRLQQDIKVMLESMKQSGADGRTTQTNETKKEVEGIRQDGQTVRWNQPSGNTIYSTDSRERVAGADRTSRDKNFADGLAETVRSNTSKEMLTGRGQDITKLLGMTRDGTVRRGQDINQQLGIGAEAGRNDRATAANALREKENAERIRLEQDKLKAKNRNPMAFVGSDTPTDVPDEGTGKPTAQPIEVKETTGGLPVSPRSPEAGADINGQLKQQLSAALARYAAATSPAQKEAAKQEIARLRARAQQKSQ